MPETRAIRQAADEPAHDDRTDGSAPGGRSVAGVQFFEPRVVPIVKATDLGSVQVLKHGNLFLLTDQFGDIHSDSRGLGLYRDDTRLLSCSVLRIGEARPVVLQGSTGAPPCRLRAASPAGGRTGASGGPPAP